MAKEKMMHLSVECSECACKGERTRFVFSGFTENVKNKELALWRQLEKHVVQSHSGDSKK